MGGLILVDVELVKILRLKGLKGLNIEETTSAVLHDDHSWVGLTRWVDRKEVVLLRERLPTR